MKMIIQHSKVNILPVQNELGGHIWDGLWYWIIVDYYIGLLLLMDYYYYLIKKLFLSYQDL